VYDLGEDDGAYYIAMEFVEGVNLTRIMEVAREHRVRIPPSVVLDIGIQICRGLTYAHDIDGEDGQPLQLVHRDLKPSNIMVSMGGQAKLMDFGIAKASSNLFDTTETGIAKGTPLYMSPEQLRGIRPLKAASDLFSLGVLLYEMTTGKLLFAGRTIPEIITKVLNQPLKEQLDAADARIPGIRPVLARLLDRDVAARYQDANEVRVELEHLLEWQDKNLSTAEVAQAVFRGDFPGSQRMDTTAASLLPIVDRDDVDPTSAAEGDPEYLAKTAGETLVDTYMRRQRRRRQGLLAMFALAAALAIGVATYVFRGTLGVSLSIDSARDAMNHGDLQGALDLWEQALSENPGRADARFGAATLQSWAGAPVASISRSLEFAPEEEKNDFARKYLAFGRVLRRGGEYTEAFRNLKLALDAARKHASTTGTPLPPELLQEAAEVALVLGSPDAARGYFQEVVASEPAGALSDLASAWADAITEGRGAMLAAELLYIDGRLDEAYNGLLAALDAASGSRERLQEDRLLWAFRALGDERYELAENLVSDLGPVSGEKDRRRSAAVALTAAQAGRGRTTSARKELTGALKLADTAAERAAVRLQVALALVRSEGDLSWAASLVEEAALEVGDDDRDVQYVLGLMEGEPPPRSLAGFSQMTRLAIEARSGRFLPVGLMRGGPLLSTLIPPDAFPRENVSRLGLACPFGPTFHPIDGSLLSWVYHPGR
jgi:tetratricopeptide (TPR) repeat protein